MTKHVVFSDRAITSILAETQEKIKTETGGVFLGYRKGEVWYVIESADPGINSTFTASYFEYDQDYINHIINKLARLYAQPLELIGLWHRHPGSMDTFSTTDNGTNTEYAKLSSEGAISALVNIDPEFRLTVYIATLPLKYEKVTYSIGDDRIPLYLLSYRSQSDYLRKINNTEQNAKAEKKRDALSNLVTETYTDIFHTLKKGTKNINKIEQKKRFSFRAAITQSVALIDLTDKGNDLSVNKKISDSDIDVILDELSEDIEFLSSVGIECSITNQGNYIELTETLLCSDVKPVILQFYLDDDNKIFCKCDDSIFEYTRCFVKDSIIKHSMRV